MNGAYAPPLAARLFCMLADKRLAQRFTPFNRQIRSLLCLDGPSELGRTGPGVFPALLRRGPYYLPCGVAVNAIFKPLFKSGFDKPVLPGMEGQYGHPSAAGQSAGQFFQKGVKRFIFRIDIYPQGLEGALAGFFNRLPERESVLCHDESAARPLRRAVRG